MRRRQDISKPLFDEPPDNCGEDWSGFVIGGMAQADELSLARAYMMAGNAIVAKALRSSDLSFEFAYPTLYCYCHALELYLKMTVRPTKRTHGLLDLAKRFVAIVQAKLKMTVPDAFVDRIREFEEMDPNSQAFRYAEDRDGREMFIPGEMWVRFRRLRKTMNIMATGFEKAYHALPRKSRR